LSWRAALIDSCGVWPGACEAASFASVGGAVEPRAPFPDPTGHGSRLAQLLSTRGTELMLAQVFPSAAPSSAAAVAAAITWALKRGANLIHMSLGLAVDRPVLRAAVAQALAGGAIVVASTPARGPSVYPAAYAGVIRGTGDARCAPGELSCLGAAHFGSCPRFAPGTYPADDAMPRRGGASAGAAWVSRALLEMAAIATADQAVSALRARCRFFGPERVGMEARPAVSR